MKKLTWLAVILTLGAGAVQAQSQTEKEITQLIIDSNAHTRKTLKAAPDEYSKAGALEFWSSGGLLQVVPPGGTPDEFESFSIEPKHIQVLALVEGQAAVAHYYTEGSMKPKGSPAVPHYLVRVTQAYVKEGGKWKIRSSHWSAVAGGSGTSQSAATN